MRRLCAVTWQRKKAKFADPRQPPRCVCSHLFILFFCSLVLLLMLLLLLLSLLLLLVVVVVVVVDSTGDNVQR